MQKIVPNLWFNEQAEAAVDFYVSVFPDSARLATSYYPTENLPDFQQPFAGQPLSIEFRAGGLHCVAINAGDEFAPTPATSFMVNFDPATLPDAAAQLDTVWESLTDGGTVLMPLDSYPFSSRYGWVQDRFGVSWQLILTDPDGEPRPMMMPALMFCGPAQNRAREAIDYWTSVFPDSQLGLVAEYHEPTGPAPAGAIMFSDFTLAGQWFVAMDSGVEQPFGFTEGVSMLVNAQDQDEIDRYWEALALDPATGEPYVPEAAQCGWCRDRFGHSWQIAPDNIEELIQHPGGYQALLGMSKIVISEFG